MQRGLDKPFYFLLFSYFSDTSGGLEELFELLWGWYFALWHGKKQVSCMCLYQRKCKDFLLNENSSTNPGGSDPSGCQGREPAKEEETAYVWWREKGVRERINRQTWSKMLLHIGVGALIKHKLVTELSGWGSRATSNPGGADGAEQTRQRWKTLHNTSSAAV